MKTFITILITAVLAAAGMWLFTNRSTPAPASAGTEHKPHHYQCAMHPWIRSDKPGRCTICGMELTPIFTNEPNNESAASANMVTLTQTQVRVVGVQTVEAKTQALVRSLQVAGMIDDDERRHRIISAYVDGRVDKLFANHHGAEVVEGAPLADLYSPELLQAQREYRNLTGELRANTALRLRQMGMTQDQIDSLSDKPDEALETEILAPLSGTVVEHNIYEGQYVKAGEKLFAIADFSVMWFQFIAYEQDLPWIRIGQPVTVTTPSKPGRNFAGKITFIDPNVDDATRSAKVRVELANPLVDGHRELLHRLYADGVVQLDSPVVLTVPRSAIIQTGQAAVVYLEQGAGSYVQAPVTIGRRGDALVEILSGLQAGDKVVTNGNLLIDGQAELNRSFAPSVREAISESLIDSQKSSVRDFIQVADAMAAALAADDLDAFNKASEPAMMKTSALTQAVEKFATKENIATLNELRHFHGSENLETARVAFLKFSLAATAVLEPLRSTKGFPEMAIWECPMVDQAVPGAAKKGRWIQTKGRSGANPFFGKAMPDCGKEINP